MMLMGIGKVGRPKNKAAWSSMKACAAVMDLSHVPLVASGCLEVVVILCFHGLGPSNREN